MFRGWGNIKDAVAIHGQEKTVKQCKNKIRVLKNAYQNAKANNNKSGASADFPEHYKDFDEILGTRNIVNLPQLAEVGVTKDQHVNLNFDDSDDTDNEDLSPVMKFAALNKKSYLALLQEDEESCSSFEGVCIIYIFLLKCHWIVKVLLVFLKRKRHSFPFN